MKITFHKSLRQPFWLIGLFVFSFVFASFLPYILGPLLIWMMLDRTPLGVLMKNSYGLSSTFVLAVPIFILISFLVFFMKEIRHRFSRSTPFAIILSSGLFLIILIQLLENLLVQNLHIFSYGWTSYPPLSALPDENLTMKPGGTIIVNYGPNTLMFLQIIITGCLIFVAYSSGKNRGLKKVRNASLQVS